MIHDVMPPLHVPVGHLWYVFGKKSIQFLCPVFDI